MLARRAYTTHDARQALDLDKLNGDVLNDE